MDGDVKELARLGSLNQFDKVDFFCKEYGLDLRIHQFSKPVIVIADGFTMGGGLGIAGEPASVSQKKRTHVAMPKTRIGFFPDIGSTGLMFACCPKGYPEYPGLTDYDMIGKDCVTLGYAMHYMKTGDIPRLIDVLENNILKDGENKQDVLGNLLAKITGFLCFNIPVNPAMDEWVEKYFAGKADLKEILASLSQCHEEEEHCREVFDRAAERSTAVLVLTNYCATMKSGRLLTYLPLNLKPSNLLPDMPIILRVFGQDLLTGTINQSGTLTASIWWTCQDLIPELHCAASFFPGSASKYG